MISKTLAQSIRPKLLYSAIGCFALLSSTNAVQAETVDDFKCWGTYTNVEIVNDPQDPIGTEINVINRNEATVVFFEGSYTFYKAKPVFFEGKEFGLKLEKEGSIRNSTLIMRCEKGRLIYLKEMYPDGTSYDRNEVLKPGSYIAREKLELFTD